MAVNVTTPVTGLAQTGFVTPAYVLTADLAPDNNGKQNAITSVTGTQTGVTSHSVASPFTNTFTRPRTFRYLGKPNPTTGLVKDVPRNTFKCITRKGVLPLAGQPYQIMQITSTFDVPAGSDLADPANVRAACSLHFGVLSQVSAGIGDSLVSGVI